ncbi:hypothetical protein [Marinomonas algarum]|uniref:Uncharacterized protein n=1 Tax=Marinomonas algarum TaxID=2883105 RepID=A0A9X1RSQ7_9GAMM|nr:hypothetical protein [Marinomonas algarum]MCB5163160.1 hypothetical protein [Marinomonas algarum]
MFTASAQLNVTLICGPTYMRKTVDGFCDIVAYDLKKNPAVNTFLFSAAERAIKPKPYNESRLGFDSILSTLYKTHWQKTVLKLQTIFQTALKA